jgi:hypothetical protein
MAAWGKEASGPRGIPVGHKEASGKVAHGKVGTE